jgi:pimeloyl-ACP methyl ester carboxylesterase
MRTAIRSVVALVVLCGLIACSDGSRDTLKLETTEVNGPGTLGLSVAGQSVKGLVVYFHGSDQKADVIQNDDKHRAFFDPLLRAGYAVVSADADGNAFGNPDSRQDYRNLMLTALAKYNVESTYFVAESMGALAALALLTEDSRRQVKGMVGITPMMGIPGNIRSVSFIAYVWDGHVPDSADPMAWPPEMFEGRAIRLYAADTEDVIPAGATARDFAERVGAQAHIDVVGCVGGHVAAACYDGAGVLNWIENLA